MKWRAVAERGHEIALWKELLPRTRYVGEVGLDAGLKFYRSFDRQKEVFAEVLTSCATASDKILTVHSVRATKVVLVAPADGADLLTGLGFHVDGVGVESYTSTPV